MARIRTIKPATFRHEGLQDLEAAHPGKYPMLVFIALWGHCDKAGRFEWRPRVLKLDILPFLAFDMAETLEILEQSGQIERYESGGKTYGVIHSFADHQHIGGKEAQEPARYPEPPGKDCEATGKQRGSNGEAIEKEEGLQEGNGIKEGNGSKPSCNRTSPDCALVVGPQGESPPADPGEEDHPGLPACPHQKIIALYAKALPELPQPIDWTGTRARNMRARWRWVMSSKARNGKRRAEDEAQGLDFFARFFAYVAESDFLTGRNGKWQSCNLGWLMEAANWEKVLEGNYEPRERAA